MNGGVVLVELFLTNQQGAEELGILPAMTPGEHITLLKHMLHDFLLTGVAGKGRQSTVTRRTYRTFNSPYTAIDYLGAHELNIRHTP